MSTEQSFEFDIEKDAKLFLQNRIYNSFGIEQSDVGVVVDEIDDFFYVSGMVTKLKNDVSQDPDVANLIIPPFRYAIKSGDLKLFDSLLDILKAAIPVHFFINSVYGTPEATAFIAAAISVVKLLYSGLRGAILSKDEMLLLVALKKSRGLSLVELADQLSAIDAKYDEANIKAIIGELSQKQSLDGALTQLVVKAADEKWRANI